MGSSPTELTKVKEMVASIQKASGRSNCQGGGCGWKQKIPKGSKCLKIVIYGAGGASSAFYCEMCMKLVLDNFMQVINDADKDLE